MGPTFVTHMSRRGAYIIGICGTNIIFPIALIYSYLLSLPVQLLFCIYRAYSGQLGYVC